MNFQHVTSVTIPEGNTYMISSVTNGIMWKKTYQYYSVSFFNDTELITEQQVKRGDSATPPPNPTKTGYTFKEWLPTYTNIQNDTSCYAQYNANTYTVTFDPNGGTVSPTSKEVTYGQTYGELPTPTYDGHIFEGWFLNGNRIKSTSIVQTAATHVLKAKWSQSTVKVTLTSNDISKGIAAGSGTFNYGSTVTIMAIPNTYETKAFTKTNSGEGSAVSHWLHHDQWKSSWESSNPGKTITRWNCYPNNFTTHEAYYDESYTFNGWSDGNKQLSRNITLTSDISLTANFR